MHGDARRTTTGRPVPEWLIEAPISRTGARRRDEWAEIARTAGADDGEARLAAAMLCLRAQRPTRPLLARANVRALRWVDSAVRRGRAARKLEAVTPALPITQRLFLRAGRVSLSLAACLLLLLCKAGVFHAVDGVVRVADRLARLHFERHIWPPVS
ncbi:MAG: hypothetical protein ACE5E1_01165 [Phycisphaerae bacterium]